MNEATARVEETLDYVAEQNPHSQAILDAFKTLMTERNRLRNDIDLKPVDTQFIDMERLKGGVPVIRQIPLFLPDDPGNAIALVLIPALAEGLPTLYADLDALKDHIVNGDIQINHYLLAFPDHGQEIIARWSKQFKIQETTLLLVVKQVTRVLLEKRAGKIVTAFPEFEWNKGCCPICGAFPAVSTIQEQTHQRWLHCADCGHEWRFSRVICPYCENEEPEGMTFFFVEDRKREMAFMCDKCNRYVITINRVDDISDYDLEIRAMGLVHLDMIMQEKGLTPMKDCTWNIFM